MGLAGINQGEWGLSDIGQGLSELVDIKGAVGMSRGQWGLVDIKGGNRNSQILTEVKILQGGEGVAELSRDYVYW